MKHKVKKRKSGKGQRSAILLRLAPDLAEWYTSKARAEGRSRNRLMEMWLEALADVVREAEEWGSDAEAVGELP